jgi:hypothetical protein
MARLLMREDKTSPSTLSIQKISYILYLFSFVRCYPANYHNWSSENVGVLSSDGDITPSIGESNYSATIGGDRELRA